ncbi:MAG: hypothetical protein GQ570_10380 [Helicobacteraceae bacterium]|nr:hypothetical protein [Helicobacteraceae bacterium]
MRYVEPIDLLDTLVINYNSVDSALSEWDPSKSDYALGNVVKVAADKKKYKLAASVVEAGAMPSQNPTIWQGSPLSEYAMFEHKKSTLSQSLEGIKFSFSGAGVDTLYLQDIDGTQVSVHEKNEAGEILQTQTKDIYEYEIASLGEYLFQRDTPKNRTIQFNINSLLVHTIEVEITGVCECRYFIAGQKAELGHTLVDGIDYNLDDFFTQERDAWGDIIWSDSRIIESATLPVLADNSVINSNVNRLQFLQGKPILWIADDREVVEFDFINIFGRLLNVRVSPLINKSTKSLQIEGM